MVFDLPDVVHADAVGEFNLGERFPIDVVLAPLVPRARRFHFIKQAELHSFLHQAKGLVSCRDSPSFLGDLPTVWSWKSFSAQQNF